MFLRKLFAAFLVFLFVIAAIPNFFIYALSRTFLDTDFYKRQDLSNGAYEFVLDKTTIALQNQSKAVNGFFRKDELKKQIATVFSKKVFSNILTDFANQLEIYKQNPEKPLGLSLKLLRDNLLTVANNLAYAVYQDLPSCSETPTQKELLPSCLPKNTNYDVVVKPLLADFESAVYNAVPDQLDNIDKAVPLHLMIDIADYRNISFAILIGLIALIAIALWKPISSIVSYMATAFLLSGSVGLLMGYFLENVFENAMLKNDDAKMIELLKFLLSFMSAEIIRLAGLFLVVGLALMLIKFILRRTVDNTPNFSHG